MKRPFLLWILILLLLSLSLGGFSGAIPMLADPANGGYLDFGHLLESLPVNNFILPGLFLLFFMSLFPLFLSYGLIAKPVWPWTEKFIGWSKHHWSWTGTIVLVIGTVVWLTVEGLMVGWWPITTITAVQAGLILMVALVPKLRKYYSS